ncbi:5042_t:CDS:2, partial [Cetraspora pellucida]
AITTRLNLKLYTNIDGNINLLDHQRVVCQIKSLHRIINKCRCKKKCKYSPIPYNLWLDEIVSIIAQAHTRKTFCLASNKETVLAELWEWAKQISSLPPMNEKDVQGIVHALRTDFPKLHIKNYHDKSDPAEKAQDFSNVDETWKEVDLVAYTSTLKIDISCTNYKFERAFCLFNSYIKTNAGTNQMLFYMRCIKNYVYYIEQRASNVPIIEEELFNWLLKAKRESLPLELQNREIFPDVESIIRNKDISTIRLWVAYMLEKFQSHCLFGWRMVDFLKKAGMIISIIKAIPKAKDNTVTLTETVKGKQTKEDFRRNIYVKLDHIADCYEVSSESITEEFITDYDIDDRNRYKVFDNTNASRSAKKSGLKSDKAKLGLLNSALSTIYEIKFKTTNNKNTYYHLVGTFDYEDASKLPPYQTDEGQFYENDEDMHYGYSKLSPDELEPSPNCISQNTQDLFDII